MKLIVNKNKYFFLLLAIICTIAAQICLLIMPSKFFNDAELIVNDPYNEIGFIGGYPFSMLFYKVTLLRYLPYFFIALIQIPILLYILYRIGVPTKFKVLSVENIVIYISFFLIALYVSIPSKEFINFLYIAIITFLFKSKRFSVTKTVLISFVMFIVFAIVFRPYYVFIPIISTVMFCFVFVKSKYKVWNMIMASIFIVIFMSLSYGALEGKYISASTRESHNKDRLAKEAQSMLVSPIPTDTWYGETIGIYYGYISVNLPINGLKHYMKPQVIAFVIWQFFLFSILLIRFAYCVRHRHELKYELWIFLFIFAFFVVQGLFEPDLGSAVRHKFSIFPFIYLAFYYDKLIKDKQESNT